MIKMEGAKTVGNQKTNLYLLGFMGTGKSSLGKRLAACLDFDFLDSDAEIEKKCGMEIKDIFAKHGEDYFRKMEREFIENGHPSEGCVVACGGGLVCRAGMPELVKSKGVSVVLFSKPEEILERISRNDKRPLLNVPDPLGRIKELLAERTPFYMKSGIAIVADPNLKETEEHILRIYAAEKRRFKRKKLA